MSDILGSTLVSAPNKENVNKDLKSLVTHLLHNVSQIFNPSLYTCVRLIIQQNKDGTKGMVASKIQMPRKSGKSE